MAFAGVNPLMSCYIFYVMPVCDCSHISFYRVTVLSSVNTLCPTLLHLTRLAGPTVSLTVYLLLRHMGIFFPP